MLLSSRVIGCIVELNQVKKKKLFHANPLSTVAARYIHSIPSSQSAHPLISKLNGSLAVLHIICCRFISVPGRLWWDKRHNSLSWVLVKARHGCQGLPLMFYWQYCPEFHGLHEWGDKGGLPCGEEEQGMPVCVKRAACRKETSSAPDLQPCGHPSNF